MSSSNQIPDDFHTNVVPGSIEELRQQNMLLLYERNTSQAIVRSLSPTTTPLRVERHGDTVTISCWRSDQWVPILERTGPDFECELTPGDVEAEVRDHLLEGG